MHPELILSRTGLAQTEIRERSHRLSPRLRRLLLLVDGQTSVAGTVERYGGLIGPEIDAMIGDLLAQGYLAGAAMQTTAAGVPSAPSSARTAADTPTLAVARERALALLAAAVGPVGGRLGAGAARQMERLGAAGSAADWTAALDELDAALPRLVPRREIASLRVGLAALRAVQDDDPGASPAVATTADSERLDGLRTQALALLAEAVGPVGGRMNAAAARRGERIGAAGTAAELQAALDELDESLPRLVGRRELERVRGTLGRLRRAVARG